MSELTGWIAVDLDGTLADYSEWKGPEHIGAPVPLMVERVKAWRAEGKDIRIFTARVAHDEDGSVLAVIDRWCEEHLGERLPVTNTKDYGMVELWDDRCVQIIPNTGRRADGVDAPPSERVPEKIAGMAVVLDPTVPLGVAQIRDANGKLCAELDLLYGNYALFRRPDA